MSKVEDLELEELLERLHKLGYMPIGLVFYDAKLKLVGLAPMSKVPDEFVEMLGHRLSGAGGGTSWAQLSKGDA